MRDKVGRVIWYRLEYMLEMVAEPCCDGWTGQVAKRAKTWGKQKSVSYIEQEGDERRKEERHCR
jgi:hypothetical protein